MKCKYSDDGCEFEQMPSKKQALEDHQKECEHRTITCTVVWCDKTVSLSKLRLHQKDDHNETIFETKGSHVHQAKIKIFTDYRNKWLSWSPRLFTLNDGKQFYWHFAHSPLGFFFLWVYMIGTQKDEEHFTC